MTAREMFEKLGYKQEISKTYCIKYEKIEATCCTRFIFLLEARTFATNFECYGYGVSSNYMELDEFKAVIQQYKELGWIEEEQKEETNYERYKDEIIENCSLSLALFDGKPYKCSDINCCDCGFSTGHGCSEKIKEWLKSPYKKPTYKLSQFEYDLIKTFDRCKECCLLNEIECLKKLIEKGYFKGIDPFTKVHDIIDNCEVIQ